MSSPALKGRQKSAIKASNSETMVNVWIAVLAADVMLTAVLAAATLVMLTGYKLIAD